MAGAGQTAAEDLRRSPCPHLVPPPRPTPSSSRPGRRAPTRSPRPACPRTGPRRSWWSATPTGRLRDLDWAPDADDRRRAGRDRLARTGSTCCATRPRTCWPRPCRTSSPRPSSASARRSRTASTTTSTCAKPFQPDDLDKLEKRMQEIVKSGQRFRGAGSTRLDEAKAELADEPYKLELVDIKGDVGRDRGHGGRRRRADHLRQPRRQDRRALLGRPVPRPAPADHPADRRVQADARRPPRTGAAPRRTRSCSGSTAPRGRPGTSSRRTWSCWRRPPGATTASSAPSSTCSRFPDEIGSGLAVFHPKGGIIRRELEDYSRRRHEEAGYEFVNTPHITKEQLFRDLGPPAVLRRRRCSRRWRWRARTTTSSR